MVGGRMPVSIGDPSMEPGWSYQRAPWLHSKILLIRFKTFQVSSRSTRTTSKAFFWPRRSCNALEQNTWPLILFWQTWFRQTPIPSSCSPSTAAPRTWPTRPSRSSWSGYKRFTRESRQSWKTCFRDQSYKTVLPWLIVQSLIYK